MTEITNTNGGAAQVITLRNLPTSKEPKATASVDLTTEDVGVSESTSAIESISRGQPDQAESDKSPLERAAEAISAFIPEGSTMQNTKLRINKDDATGLFVYQNVDKETGEVIQQYPPESIKEMLAHYRDIAGLAVDNNA